MKLLLTSNGLTTTTIKTTFLQLLSKSPANIHLLYVPTAALSDGLNENIIKQSLAKIYALGIKSITMVDFNKTTKEYLMQEFIKSDAVWVGGGNTFYLLESARKCGFLDMEPELKNHNAVYVGVSAGSILAGPDIKICELTEPEENLIACKNLKALGLVNFSIFPHYDPSWNVALHDTAKQVPYQLLPLRDDQAIVVTNEGYQII